MAAQTWEVAFHGEEQAEPALALRCIQVGAEPEVEQGEGDQNPARPQAEQEED